MTKALMERLFIEANRYGREGAGRAGFNLARYGNVVGSTGSVIPLFKRQAQENGQLTLTDPKMTRYWQSIQESVELIRKAANVAVAGCIVIPAGRSMTMMDLTQTIAEQQGRAKIKVVGPRPGEKQHESLMAEHESLRAIWNGEQYILWPAGSIPNKDQSPFSLSSATAKQVTPGEMLEMIQVSEQV
jgi:UDP-N-acetylglucosamine 4,6-dehydratase